MRHESLNVLHVHLGNGDVAALVARRVPTFAAVEVILTVFALKEFAGSGEFHALRHRLFGFEFHSK